MRLLIDAHIFDDKFQGTRSYLEGLYLALIPLAPHIDFFFAAQDVNHLQRIFGQAHNVHYIQLTTHNPLSRLGIEYPRLIRKHNIDYAHFQYISPFIKHCKEIVTVHDVLFMDFPQFFPISYRLKNELLFRFSAKKADLLLTVSDYSRKAIAEKFKINRSSIHVTPNAVSEIYYSGDLKKSGYITEKFQLDKYILYVGRIEPRKNHLSLTRAVAELGLLRAGYKLVYIGQKDLNYPQHDEYIASLSVEEQENVVFLTGISNEDLKHFYLNCNLFVFPSFAEGFGIPAIEAFATGCECLCSDQTAMADFSFYGERFFNPYDEEELKTKIEKALNGLIPPIGPDDIEKVKNQYRWKNIAKEFLSVLDAQSIRK